jgi:hypothetical protein
MPCSHPNLRINQNTLFSLGMLTYTYERQDIIQIALKRLPGGGSAVTYLNTILYLKLKHSSKQTDIPI